MIFCLHSFLQSDMIFVVLFNRIIIGASTLFETKSTSNIKNTLTVQKSRIKRIAIDYLCAALLILLLNAICLIVALTLEDKAHANRILYAVIPCLSVFFAVLLFFSIKRFFLFHAFDRARFYNECKIKIDCKRVKFTTYTTIRTSLPDIIAIVFVDIDRKKYVYVLPNQLICTKKARVEVRKKCAGRSVEFICYNNTKMIKSCDILNQTLNSDLT